MRAIIVHTLSKSFTRVATFSGVLAVQDQPVDFYFNADPVILKLVTRNKIVFRAARDRVHQDWTANGTLVLLQLQIRFFWWTTLYNPKWKRDAHQSNSRQKAKKSPIHGTGSKRNEKQWHHKATKQNGIISKKWHFVYFSKIKTLFCFSTLIAFCFTYKCESFCLTLHLREKYFDIIWGYHH